VLGLFWMLGLLPFFFFIKFYFQKFSVYLLWSVIKTAKDIKPGNVSRNIMEKLLKIIFSLLVCGNMFSQTKQELIKAIKEINVVDDGPNYISSSEDSSKVSRYNAENFEKLKKLISEDELLKLSNNTNKVLRAYAIQELIWTENKKFDIVETFCNEIKKDQVVETIKGCIGDYDKLYSIVYHGYWNYIGKEKRDSDFIMQKLDSVVISSNNNLFWLLYSRAFENGKQNDLLLPKIEKLAFKRNNSYAILYLKKYYSEKYSEKIKSYLLNDFSKAKFKSDENDVFYFHDLIELLLDSNDENMKTIAIEKLRTEKIWKNYSSWFDNMLEEHKINL
jgi:hypothetical protein